MKILDLIDLNEGQILKQGDTTLLRFQIADRDNLLPDKTGSEAKIIFLNNNMIVYEELTTVKSGNIVEFSIQKVLLPGVYVLEIHVGGQIFPSDDYIFKITRSALGSDVNLIELYGIDAVVNKVVDELGELITDITTTHQEITQAEAQRVSAESARVSAEEQRKADKVIIENLTKSDVRWVAPYGVSTYADGEITYEISTPAHSARVEFTINAVAGDVYYGYFEIYAEFANTSYFKLGTIIGLEQTPKVKEWHAISDVLKSDVPGRPSFFHSTVPNYNIGDKVKYRHMMALNLTKIFGAGNEPTKEEMDELIKITGYIDVKYALNNKEMLMWTLALIRRNKNAIIALGGA